MRSLGRWSVGLWAVVVSDVAFATCTGPQGNVPDIVVSKTSVMVSEAGTYDYVDVTLSEAPCAGEALWLSAGAYGPVGGSYSANVWMADQWTSYPYQTYHPGAEIFTHDNIAAVVGYQSQVDRTDGASCKFTASNWDQACTIQVQGFHEGGVAGSYLGGHADGDEAIFFDVAPIGVTDESDINAFSGTQHPSSYLMQTPFVRIDGTVTDIDSRDEPGIILTWAQDWWYPGPSGPPQIQGDYRPCREVTEGWAPNYGQFASQPGSWTNANESINQFYCRFIPNVAPNAPVEFRFRSLDEDIVMHPGSTIRVWEEDTYQPLELTLYNIDNNRFDGDRISRIEVTMISDDARFDDAPPQIIEIMQLDDEHGDLFGSDKFSLMEDTDVDEEYRSHELTLEGDAGFDVEVVFTVSDEEQMTCDLIEHTFEAGAEGGEGSTVMVPVSPIDDDYVEGSHDQIVYVDIVDLERDIAPGDELLSDPEFDLNDGSWQGSTTLIDFTAGTLKMSQNPAGVGTPYVLPEVYTDIPTVPGCSYVIDVDVIDAPDFSGWSPDHYYSLKFAISDADTLVVDQYDNVVGSLLDDSEPQVRFEAQYELSRLFVRSYAPYPPREWLIDAIRVHEDGCRSGFDLMADALVDAREADGLSRADMEVELLDDDVAGLAVVMVDGMDTTEAGGTVDVRVSLTAKPYEPVYIVPFLDSDEAVVSNPGVAIDPDNWETGVIVTLTGMDDLYYDQDQSYTVDYLAVSADANFSGLQATSDHKNLDDDFLNLELVGGADLELVEGQTVDAVFVSLTWVPDEPVEVVLTAPEGVSLSETTVVIEPGQAMVPQIVSLEAIDDDLLQGDRPFTLTAELIVGEGSVDVETATGVILDDEIAGLVATGVPVVDEAGGTAVVQVHLTAQPMESSVTIDIGTSDASEAMAPASVTIAAEDWDVPVEVTLSGVDDAVDDGDQAFAVDFSISAESDWDGVTAQLLGVNLDDDISGVAPSWANVTVDENGGIITFPLALLSEPLAPVELTVASGDQFSTAQPAVSLSAETWQSGPSVELLSLDDRYAQGDRIEVVQLMVSSEDPTYDGLVEFVAVQVIDDDTAGIDVSVDTDTLAEPGGTANITLQPTAAPMEDVVLSLMVEGDITAPTEVTLPADSEDPVVFSVELGDDPLVEGPEAGIVGFTLTGDPAFVDAGAPPVDLTIDDDDVAGMEVRPIETVATEDGQVATYVLTLIGAPMEDVTVGLSPALQERANMEPSVVVFPAGVESEPVSVDVVAVDNEFVDGDVAGEMEFQVLAGPDAYLALAPATAPVEVLDNDVEANVGGLFARGGLGCSNTGAPGGMLALIGLLGLRRRRSASILAGLSLLGAKEAKAACSVTPAPQPELVFSDSVSDILLSESGTRHKVWVTLSEAPCDTEAVTLGFGSSFQPPGLGHSNNIDMNFGWEPFPGYGNIAYSEVKVWWPWENNPMANSSFCTLDDTNWDTGCELVFEGVVDTWIGFPTPFTDGDRTWFTEIGPLGVYDDSGQIARGDSELWNMSIVRASGTTKDVPVPREVGVMWVHGDDYYEPAYPGATIGEDDPDYLPCTVIEEGWAPFATVGDPLDVGSFNERMLLEDEGGYFTCYLYPTIHQDTSVRFEIRSLDPDLIIHPADQSITTFSIVDRVAHPVRMKSVDNDTFDGDRVLQIEVSFHQGDSFFPLDPMFVAAGPQILEILQLDDEAGGILATAPVSLMEDGSTPEDQRTAEVTLEGTVDFDTELVFTIDDAEQAVCDVVEATYLAGSSAEVFELPISAVDDDRIDGDVSTLLFVDVVDLERDLSETDNLLADPEMDGLANGWEKPAWMEHWMIADGVAHMDPHFDGGQGGSSDYAGWLWQPVETTANCYYELNLTFDQGPEFIDYIWEGSYTAGWDVLTVATRDGTVAHAEDWDSWEAVGGYRVPAEHPIVFQAHSDTTDLLLLGAPQQKQRFDIASAELTQLGCLSGFDVEYDRILDDRATDEGAVEDGVVTVIDDDVPGLVLSPSAMGTTEDGAPMTVVATLLAQPEADVWLVASTDTEEAHVLTLDEPLTEANWNSGVTLTLVGMDDDVYDGDVAYTLSVTTLSDDPHFMAITETLDLVNYDDDLLDLGVLGDGDLEVEEGTTTDAIFLSLQFQPDDPMMVDITTTNPWVSVQDPQLMFDASNWNIPQAVRVIAPDEDYALGTQTFDLLMELTDGAGILDSEIVTGLREDDDRAGVAWDGVALAQIEEGQTGSLQVRLTARPQGDVTLQLSHDGGDLLGALADVVIPEDQWDMPHTVDITASDDATVDGDRYATIFGVTDSADPVWSGLDAPLAAVQIRDNDVAGIGRLGGDVLLIDEGDSFTFDVALTAQPRGGATVTLSADEGLEISPASLSFDEASWDTPQSVTLTATDDAYAIGDRSLTYQLSLGSPDAVFDGISGQEPVGIVENDEAGVDVVNTAGSVDEGDVLAMQIVPRSAPMSDVTITATLSGGVSAAAEITLPADATDAVSWDLTHDADELVEGLLLGSITWSTASDDPAFDGLVIPPIDLELVDDDPGRVFWTGDDIRLLEGESGGFEIGIEGVPATDVRVSVVMGMQSRAEAAVEEIIFLAGEPSTPRTVRVDALDNAYIDGDVAGNIELVVTSGPAPYRAEPEMFVPVSVVDNDLVEEPETPETGGCSSTGGGVSGWVIAVALLARRRQSTARRTA